MKYYLVLVAVLIQCYVCSSQNTPCSGGAAIQYTSPCQQQTQMQCPPNTVYSNGVCVAQQYLTMQQPSVNFLQAPSSCGANMVLYNGGCQPSNVATCPYSSSLQNGICTRNQPMQPYPMQMVQQYQMPQILPQQMQMARPLPQPMQMSSTYQIAQPMQMARPLPQPMQIAPTYQMPQAMYSTGCQSGYCNNVSG